MNRYFYIFFLLFSLVFQVSNANALGRDPLGVDLPDVAAPDGASWYWVGKKMAYNDIPMSIKMFEYAGSEEDVESFYRNYWRVKGHGQSFVKNMGLYKILSHDLRGVYTTVQYRVENGLVKGKVVVTESPGRARSSRKSLLPVPPSAEVASKVESLDGAKRSETLTIESFKSIDFNKSYYENQMEYDGWALVYQSTGDRSSVQHYQKQSELLQITIKTLSGIDNNHTQILIHWVK